MFDYKVMTNDQIIISNPPRGDAGDLSREYVLRIPNVS